MMNTNTKNKLNLAAGTSVPNSQQAGIPVRMKVKSGGRVNHNQTGIAVRTNVKAGRISTNHNQTAPVAA